MDWNTTLAALAFIASIGVLAWVRHVGGKWHRAEITWRALRREYEA